MGSVNKVILVGNLGRDAELRYTPGGGCAVATLNLATTEVWNDKAGQSRRRPSGTASCCGASRPRRCPNTS